MLDLEKKYYSEKVKYIAGTDEAGRGCLLGPVVIAAVILPPDFYDESINDSKKMSEKQREAAFELIQKVALDISITIVEPAEIDRINILEASRFGMENCLKSLKHEFQFALTDAVKLKNYDGPYEAIIKGDAKAISIAAASIIAKVTRDRICYELDKKYPIYNIRNNKGYGTKDHLDALDKYGPVEGLHRFSYKPVKNALIEKISLF
jgi:ribonuclease HII